MSDPTFKPVDYDFEFPATATEALKAPQEFVVETPETVVSKINLELQKIGLGTSKMTPHAVQIREGATPFIASLKTFTVEPTIERGKVLVDFAKQDFGNKFGTFVESLMISLFGSK
jgi:hypothetical protein